MSLRAVGTGPGIAIGVGALVALSLAGPAIALQPTSQGALVPKNKIVSQASGSALSVSLSGQKTGSGEFVAEHDGRSLHTEGRNTPMIPLLDGQRDVVGGALGQDAKATKNGRSVACAGLVGRNGTVEVGEHETCLVTGNGRITLSLGTLEKLGLGDVLGKLPKLPELPGGAKLELPDMALVIEGRAVTAKCSARPGHSNGSSSPLDAEVVAIVDGKRIPIADLPPGGGSLALDDILDKLPAGLPPELKALLEQLLKQIPPNELQDKLPDNPLLTVVTNEQVRDHGMLTVTALRVAVAPPTLADIRVGTVSCGPNRALTLPRPVPTPTVTPTPGPEPTDVPTNVPAGLASAPADDMAPVNSNGGIGWGTAALLVLLALTIGGYVHRRRHPTRADHG